MKYLQWFETEEQYNSFISGGFIRPNVSYVLENDMCYFHPYLQVGDVAYWDGSSVKTVSLDRWNESMGTAVGVVVIPPNFLPDGKARIMAVQYGGSLVWYTKNDDVKELITYNGYLAMNEDGSFRSDYGGFPLLPSDGFTGMESSADPMAKYRYSTIGNRDFAPSPYISDGSLNPDYIASTDIYPNLFSDFNGKGNTDILVELGSDCEAANYAKNYTVDGVSGIDWYLPAIGELGVMAAREVIISKTARALNKKFTFGGDIWSSTEGNGSAFLMSSYDWQIQYYNKDKKFCVHPFAMIEEPTMSNETDTPIINYRVQVGDVAYWDGSSIQTVSLDRWNESMGIAVGVVVIPSNFLPDGNARMVALNQDNEMKNREDYSSDTELINYNRVPITDNTIYNVTSSNSYGFLPSDIYNGSKSFIDPFVKYNANSSLIPSPYLSDGTLNPEYCKEIDGYNNALSDFNGKINTNILSNLNSKDGALKHAKNYTVEGVSGIEWYLPACGELGVMIARLGKINKVISTLGGITIPTHHPLWSSSENHVYQGCYVHTGPGYVEYDSQNYEFYVRSFAIIKEPTMPDEPDTPIINYGLQAGDVAYWNGSSIQTVSLDRWNESMGTPVGVVVIPGDFLPDGKARMIALKQSNEKQKWGEYGKDISDLVNYDRVPMTDNAGSTTTGSDSSGYLPSDKFTGTQSFVDPLAKYQQSSDLIPSPYLSDGSLNPEYMKTIDGYNNALSDFNGKGNTDILVGLGSDYAAANHAKDYTIDGVSGINWYLPAMGELGVMLARLGKINKVIISLGGVAVPTSDSLWSSSEYSSSFACHMHAFGGTVFHDSKYVDYYVRSFAIIDNNASL